MKVTIGSTRYYLMALLCVTANRVRTTALAVIPNLFLVRGTLTKYVSIWQHPNMVK